MKSSSGNSHWPLEVISFSCPHTPPTPNSVTEAVGISSCGVSDYDDYYEEDDEDDKV